MSDIYGTQEMYDENINLLSYFDIPLEGSSSDNTLNSYGRHLVDFVKAITHLY